MDSKTSQIKNGKKQSCNRGLEWVSLFQMGYVITVQRFHTAKQTIPFFYKSYYAAQSLPYTHLLNLMYMQHCSIKYDQNINTKKIKTKQVYSNSLLHIHSTSTSRIPRRGVKEKAGRDLTGRFRHSACPIIK